MKSKWKYEIILSWSEKDRAYIAEVPELPGCAADGPSYRQTLNNVEVIIGEWIETAQELKRPIPEPRGRPWCFSGLPPGYPGLDSSGPGRSRQRGQKPGGRPRLCLSPGIGADCAALLGDGRAAA